MISTSLSTVSHLVSVIEAKHKHVVSRILTTHKTRFQSCQGSPSGGSSVAFYWKLTGYHYKIRKVMPLKPNMGLEQLLWALLCEDCKREHYGGNWAVVGDNHQPCEITTS